MISQGIRPFGWGVAGLIVLSAVLGTDVVRSANHILFCVAVAMLLVSFCWIWTRRVQFSAKRELPEFARVGEAFRYPITLENQGYRCVHSALIQEWANDPRPSLEQFVSNPEPGEDSRNIVDRFFLYYRWTFLCDENRQFEPFGSPLVESLKPSESSELWLNFCPTKRGRVRLMDLRALLPDPLGLFQRNVPLECEAEELFVLPRKLQLTTFSLPKAPTPKAGPELSYHRAGVSEDFLRLRDYRPGDAPRTIAWKTWAKTGTPHVREFESEGNIRHGLVLDSFAESLPCFEAAVSLVSTLLLDSQEDYPQFSNFYSAEESFVLKQRDQLPKRLMRLFAEIEPVRESDQFELLSQQVLRKKTRVHSLLIVFSHWTPQHEEFLKHLERAEIHAITLVVCEKRDKAPPNQRVHFLQRSQLASDFAQFAEQTSSLI